MAGSAFGGQDGAYGADPGPAALLISVNWGTYIYGVNSGQVVEASLGYFINPLVSVALGVVVLGERLRTVQWIAVGIAAVAVAVLTIDYGRPPFIALVLAFSFGFYGLLKKLAPVGATQGLVIESAVLAGPTLGLLLVLHANGQAAFGSVSASHTALLVAAGAVTAVPLMFFAAAARRVPLTTLGLVQYVAPVARFAIGLLVFREPMPPGRLAGFGLVWVAIAVHRGSAAAQPPRAAGAGHLRHRPGVAESLVRSGALGCQPGNDMRVIRDRSWMDSLGAREARPAPAAEPADGLGRREREILNFERQWWQYAGAKEQAIRDLFGMSTTRYYQVLNALIDRPEAVAADPMLVKRLRRLRASRQRARSARRLGIEL